MTSYDKIICNCIRFTFSKLSLISPLLITTLKMLDDEH